MIPDNCSWQMTLTPDAFSQMAQSLILRWHFILNISYKRHSHLRCVVAPEHIADKVRFDLHLDLPGN
jgi:hypothetical protein